jgi:hypothetical protein
VAAVALPTSPHSPCLHSHCLWARVRAPCTLGSDQGRCCSPIARPRPAAAAGALGPARMRSHLDWAVEECGRRRSPHPSPAVSRDHRQCDPSGAAESGWVFLCVPLNRLTQRGLGHAPSLRAPVAEIVSRCQRDVPGCGPADVSVCCPLVTHQLTHQRMDAPRGVCRMVDRF